MLILQVNKYPPRLFAKARFLREDWFSAAHIGEMRGERILTREEFLASEDRYLRAVYRFMSGASVANLRVHDLETWDSTYGMLAESGLDDVIDGSGSPLEGEELSPQRFENAFRRCFREVAWMEFYCERKFLVHLGHDLKLTIATDGSTVDEVQATRDDGLFVYDGIPNLPTLEAWRRINAGS